MKRIFTVVLSTVLLLSATDAFAQLSVGAGYLHSTLASTYKGKQQDNDISNGMYIGAGFDLSIVEDALKLTPGLYLNVLTSRAAASIAGFSIQSKFTEVALNLPVYLSYGLELNHAALFIYGGPTFQYGLSSKYKVDGTVAAPGIGVFAQDGVLDNYKELDYSPFNIYLGGGLGADLNEKLRVTLGFDYGMLNLYKGKEEGTKYNRYNFKIGVGYLF